MTAVEADQSGALPQIMVSLGKSLQDAIATQWVVLIVVPLLIVAGSILLRRLGRSAQTSDNSDWIAGFDLALTACLTLLVSGFVLLNNQTSQVLPEERQSYIVGLFILLAAATVLMILGARAMKKYGWEGTPPKVKKNGFMLWVVNIGGLLYLITAFVVTGGSFK